MKNNLLTYLLVCFLPISCMLDDPLNVPYKSYVPELLADGHVLATPAEVGMNASDLELIYKEANENSDLWSLRSMLVFRNNKLVGEHYFKDPDDISTQHLIWSCTKQVVGGLTGIAIEQGLIQSIDDPISMYLTKELQGHTDKSGITIKQLLQMQSGIAFSNDGVNGQTDKLLRQIPDNAIEFILDLPMREASGASFHYNDGDPFLLSAVIQNASGMHTDVWADTAIFSKIGLSNYSWRRYKDGRTFGGFGLETTPRELAKYALCIADSGRWKGEQVIPADWIVQMTQEQVETNWDYDFGYQWWVEPIRNIPFMWGHGGQFAFLVEQKDMVVVFTSIPNTQGGYQISADEVLPLVDRLIQACD